MPADQRLSASWSMDPKTGNIQRRELFGDEVVKDETVARYDAKAQIVFFKSQTLLMKYKIGVVTFLAADEKLIKSFQREDMKADAPLSKNIPPRPKKDPMQGDKTPEVVDWYFRYRFNEFCARYSVFLNEKQQPIKYTGKVLYRVPQYRKRPGDGEPEFIGTTMEEKVVSDVLVSAMKTHITFTPDECVDWNEEDPESFGPDDADKGGASVGARTEGGDE